MSISSYWLTFNWYLFGTKKVKISKQPNIFHSLACILNLRTNVSNSFFQGDYSFKPTLNCFFWIVNFFCQYILLHITAAAARAAPHFWNLSVLWQNVLSVSLKYFIIKNEMQNSLIIHSCRNQIITGDDGF